MKDLKQSTRQRFVALEFDYPAVAACKGAIAQALTDDAEMLSAINELSASLF